MVRNFVLTLNGNAQSLASVSGLPRELLDKYVHALWLQPDTGNTNPFYVGGAGVATTTGLRFEGATATVPPAPWLPSDAFKTTGTKLEDWYVIGTNGEKVRILVVLH